MTVSEMGVFRLKNMMSTKEKLDVDLENVAVNQLKKVITEYFETDLNDIVISIVKTVNGMTLSVDTEISGVRKLGILPKI